MRNDAYYKFGYDKLGPLLYGFSKWLLCELKKRGISKVFFFSRDGLIMKKSFEIVNQDNIETFYLEVSRRSLRVPTLFFNYSAENLLTMLSPSNLIPLSSIFDIVGLDIKAYSMLIKEIGLDENETVSRKTFLCNTKILTLLDMIRGDVEKNSREEYAALVEYIKQCQLGGKFAIVDIGWSGGMQRFLEQTLDMLHVDHQITGFYTGVADYYKRNIKSKNLDLNGYLFDFSHDSMAVDSRSGFVGLYEMFFLETKGSVKKYLLGEGGRVYVERFPYEYCRNGQNMPEIEKICVLQQGGLDFVKKAKECDLEMNRSAASKSLLNAGNCPSRKVLKLFADFHFYDEGVFSKLAAPKSILFYAFHVNQLKTDLYLSRWKIGFLKRLFKLPLPYLYLYELLKGLQK